jgi:hypothetical protein
MGIVNSMMHRRMRGLAKELATWAVNSSKALSQQYPTLSEREIRGKMLDQRCKYRDGNNSRERLLDRCGASLHTMCYCLGFNEMTGAGAFRVAQLAQYIDIELDARGCGPTPIETKKSYFKAAGLSEDLADMDCLHP